VSDISEWLEEHAEALREVASSSALDVRLVYMIATFVLADLDDEEIDAQLFGHGFSLNGDPDRSSRLASALSDIRCLAARSGWSARS